MNMASRTLVERLAQALDLSGLLEQLGREGGYEIVAHWTQGEFHHDVVLRLSTGPVLVVATNCNGGVKEVLAFDEVPDRWALWRHRCPDVADFAGELPPIRARAVTQHWFDPCELLRADARSELRSEFRKRQRGGGWEYAGEPSEAGCGSRRVS
jgi:hypothetical protein